MVIYWDDEEITGADKKIASIINDIEILVVKDLDEEKFSSLIVRLKGISEHFPENVKRYIDEIRDVVEFTRDYRLKTINLLIFISSLQ